MASGEAMHYFHTEPAALIAAVGDRIGRSTAFARDRLDGHDRRVA